MPDLEKRLQDYWEHIVATHPTPTAEEVIEDESDVLVVDVDPEDPRRGVGAGGMRRWVNRDLLERHKWLVAIAVALAIILLFGGLSLLSNPPDQIEPANTLPLETETTTGVPLVDNIDLTVFLPEGNLSGNNFASDANGFEYLSDGDPETPENWNWIPWGGSSDSGNIDIAGVVAQTEPGDVVGLRHLGAGQELTWVVVDLTIDFYDGTTANGRATDLPEADVEFCTHELDCTRITVRDGIWTWEAGVSRDPAAEVFVTYTQIPTDNVAQQFTYQANQ